MKNKNNPKEDLRRVKGNIYYSEEEKQLYAVDGTIQKPIKNQDTFLDGLKKQFEERTPFIKTLLQTFHVLPEDETNKNEEEEDEWFL